MNLKPEEKELGKENFYSIIGSEYMRRDFLKQSIAAASLQLLSETPTSSITRTAGHSCCLSARTWAVQLTCFNSCSASNQKRRPSPLGLPAFCHFSKARKRMASSDTGWVRRSFSLAATDASVVVVGLAVAEGAYGAFFP